MVGRRGREVNMAMIRKKGEGWRGGMEVQGEGKEAVT